MNIRTDPKEIAVILEKVEKWISDNYLQCPICQDKGKPSIVGEMETPTILPLAPKRAQSMDVIVIKCRKCLSIQTIPHPDEPKE